MINRRSVVVLLLVVVSPALAQSHIAIRGTKNIRLLVPVEDAVAMGGIKDSMRCDAAHNIYMPANRGYSSAYGSIVEVMADGRQFRRFSLDDVPQLGTGHIEDFEITDGGFLYVLAREVTKYSDLKVPVMFGSTYLLRFSPAGRLEHQTRLNTDFGDMKPTSLAALKGNDFLVAGYSYSSDKKVKLFVDLFSPDGSLKNKVVVPDEGTKASNTSTVSSMSVLRPMTVRSGGYVFVLRGSTWNPVYVFSETGDLTRTVRLQADNLEFSSPKISGSHLIVHQHHPAPKDSASPHVLTQPDIDVFPVFDLDSGTLVKQFEWRQTGELACYDNSRLTIVQQALDYPASTYWAIISAEPAKAIDTRPSQPPDVAIAFQLRWIIPCTAEAHSVPLRGDEAARRFCLSENPIVDESDVESASIDVGPFKQHGLRLTFTAQGSEKLRRATGLRGRAGLGVLIDGRLVLQLTLVEPLEHEAVISGPGLAQEELMDWVSRLNAQIHRRGLRKVTWLNRNVPVP